MTRITHRLTRLEAQRRPAHVAALLARLRQGDATTWQCRCLDVLTTVDLTTARALMDQFTDAELEAVCGPALSQYLDALCEADLSALARGDPGVTRQVQRWLRGASTTAQEPHV